jgi:hypothetical protein
MGICYKNRNQKRRSLLLYEECYRLRSSLYGKNHDLTYEILMNIAVLHDEMGFHTKSLMFYDEILNDLK